MKGPSPTPSALALAPSCLHVMTPDKLGPRTDALPRLSVHSEHGKRSLVEYTPFFLTL